MILIIWNSFVATLSTSDRTVRLIRNFRSPRWPDEGFTILQAARATSAAPTIFDALEIKQGVMIKRFVDAGLGFNNPLRLLLTEAKDLWPSRDIACLVSIGTGRPNVEGIKPSLKALAETCRDMVTDADKVAQEYKEEWQRRKPIQQEPYFRFTVQRGLGMALDEAANMGDIYVRTETYVKETEHDILDCGQRLSECMSGG
jgi:predicted acylesterase/phospholipase RssA